MAEQGYKLEDYIYDRSIQVRMAVVAHNHKLEQLANDPDEIIRGEVAKKGYGLDQFKHDNSQYVQDVISHYGCLQKRMQDLQNLSKTKN